MIFELLRAFLEDFVMYGIKDVSDIGLILSDSTDYKLLKFSCGVFAIIMRCMRMQICDRVIKDW